MISMCAHLCSRSYDDKAYGFTDVGDLRFGLFDTEFGRIVCIRGTANLYNVERDLRAWPTRSCGGYLAHRGFVRAYRDLCVGGLPTFRDQNIIATGHSLGGAIATLLAEHVGCKLVTFGSPKVYWRFGKAPELNHTRIVRDDDPVPKVPALLYSHRDEALVLRDKDHHFLQVEDHFMKGYLRAVLERGL